MYILLKSVKFNSLSNITTSRVTCPVAGIIMSQTKHPNWNQTEPTSRNTVVTLLLKHTYLAGSSIETHLAAIPSPPPLSVHLFLPGSTSLWWRQSAASVGESKERYICDPFLCTRSGPGPHPRHDWHQPSHKTDSECACEGRREECGVMYWLVIRRYVWMNSVAELMECTYIRVSVCTVCGSMGR